jgi:hypothetical protein
MIIGTLQEGIITKGVLSVPSPVRNVSDFVIGVDHNAFTSAVAGEFVATFGGNEEDLVVRLFYTSLELADRAPQLIFGFGLSLCQGRRRTSPRQ